LSGADHQAGRKRAGHETYNELIPQE
jgi:hypothetical protein